MVPVVLQYGHMAIPDGTMVVHYVPLVLFEIMLYVHVYHGTMVLEYQYGTMVRTRVPGIAIHVPAGLVFQVVFEIMFGTKLVR